MKSEHSELTQRYLVLIKIDAQNLFMRINNRHEQYMEVFSLKRDRSIFKEIFESRYQKTNLADLAHLPIEVIELTNTYYQEVEELYWYLKRTQDMPNTIEDEILREISVIKRLLDNLILYIDAELSGASSDKSSIDYFITEGELQKIESDGEFLQPETDTNTNNDS